jgi:hypothetical protein
MRRGKNGDFTAGTTRLSISCVRRYMLYDVEDDVYVLWIVKSVPMSVGVLSTCTLCRADRTRHDTFGNIL